MANKATMLQQDLLHGNRANNAAVPHFLGHLLGEEIRARLRSRSTSASAVSAWPCLLALGVYKRHLLEILFETSRSNKVQQTFSGSHGILLSATLVGTMLYRPLFLRACLECVSWKQPMKILFGASHFNKHLPGSHFSNFVGTMFYRALFSRDPILPILTSIKHS